MPAQAFGGTNRGVDIDETVVGLWRTDPLLQGAKLFRTNGLLDTYGYDAAGHRVRRSINNGATNWWQVYGIGGELVAEYAAGANPTSPGKEYAYRLGELLVVGDVGACTTRWLVTDQVGTPRILADATGTLAGVSRHDYLPFGEDKWYAIWK